MTIDEATHMQEILLNRIGDEMPDPSQNHAALQEISRIVGERLAQARSTVADASVRRSKGKGIGVPPAGAGTDTKGVGLNG